MPWYPPTLIPLCLSPSLPSSFPLLTHSSSTTTMSTPIKNTSNLDPTTAQTTTTALTKTTTNDTVITLSSAQPTSASTKGTTDQSTGTISSVFPSPSDNQRSNSTTTASSGSQENKGTPSNAGPTSSTAFSRGNTDIATTDPATTQGTLTTKASSQPHSPLTTSKSTPDSRTDSRTSIHQLITTTTPSHSQESHSTVVSSSSGPTPSVNFSVSTRKPTTHTSLTTSKETLPITTSQIPGIPLFTPRQTTGSPVGTKIVSTTEEFTHSSSNWTPTAPQGLSIPPPTWTFRDYKLKCGAAIIPSEELLILNLTGASLCEGSPPDEKLVELLCHSVKASFKPAQDQCTLQVAPILESRAVAVQRVIIETKLSPEAVYEHLKDRWDDLREAGVSDMMLGREGPPEANEDRFSLPLIITIVCMASFLLLVAALYGCCHQRISQRKDQQRLTEELQTVENGYHDNPTLEVMETPSEMQEKKVVNLNGELGDSWIVPLDNLTKDDLDEEEDTHL
ncbi:Podxl [Phodopus roborovskii]|uniref:Podocalyxin n=1 Tax=Phodopus roborovskii TaxID=109678 RepID=A0AAU9YUP4_PHORO|nr:Podxl [Phodopus roborovskii]